MKKNLGNTPIVAPLPVLIVATYDEHGTPNAMNVAWGGQCGYHHVALNLSLNHKTTEILKHTKAYTLSIATPDTLVLSDYSGLVSKSLRPLSPEEFLKVWQRCRSGCRLYKPDRNRRDSHP